MKLKSITTSGKLNIDYLINTCLVKDTHKQLEP
jgi:hypothetical protein